MFTYTVSAPEGIQDIPVGQELSSVLIPFLAQMGLQNGDIIVLTHKIISKAEGCVYKLSEITPSELAEYYANISGKDPRLVQIILNESMEVLYCQRGLLLCRDKRGLVCANAGVDESNVKTGYALTLPPAPDITAKLLHMEWSLRFHKKLGVLICDTQGRPFRTGASGIAIGAAGLCTQQSYIGKLDLQGHKMRSTLEAVADELAAAATLAMGQGDEGRPMAIIRGCAHLLGEGSAIENVRKPEEDVCLRLLCKEKQVEKEL